MAKQCQCPNCTNPVFNNRYGYCRFHLWMSEEYRNKRLAEKEAQMRRSKPLSPKKGYKIPKVSKKLSEERKGYSQVDLFNEIWNGMETPRICPVSHMKLDGLKGTKLWYSCFAHILPKGRYSKLKLLKENILVVHPRVHTLYDQGTQQERDEYTLWNWDVLYNKRDELKEKYR